MACLSTGEYSAAMSFQWVTRGPWVMVWLEGVITVAEQRLASTLLETLPGSIWASSGRIPERPATGIA